jgi:flagellar hook-length control protein FliK
MLLPQSSAPASKPVPLASAQADPAGDIFLMPATQPQGEEPHTSVPAQPPASAAEQSEAPPKPAPVQNKVLPASVQADTSGLRLAETPSAETRPSAPEEDEAPSLHSSAPVQSTVPRVSTQAENDGDEADAPSAGAASASADAVPVPLRVSAAAEPETIQVPAVAPVRAPVVSTHETTRPAAPDDKPSEETPVAQSSESNPIAMRDAFTAWARSRAPGKTEISASRPARPELDRTEPSASVSARPEAASDLPPSSASSESHNAAGRDAAPLGMRAPVAAEAGTAALSPPAPVHNAFPPAEIVAQVASPQPVAAPDTPIALELRVIAGMPYTVQGMDKLALRIAAKSAAGENEFTIRLNPPELGGIEVKLHVDAAGKASASLAADLPPTLDLLQRDSATLERVMKETGLDLSGGLTFSLKGEGESGGRGMQGHAPEKHLQFTTAEDAAANTVAAASSAGEWGVTTRLDISV